MAKVSYSKEQQEYIDGMEKAISKAKELKASEGYVVAGFGGDTYYCYVGDGRGFQGSCFFPACVDAVVFDTEKEAQDLLASASVHPASHSASQQLSPGIEALWGSTCDSAPLSV